MQIHFPWRTVHGTPNGRAKWRCAAAMVAHELIFEPWGKLTGVSEHARPNRWTTRYAIGIPFTYVPAGMRGIFINKFEADDFPTVVDGALLFEYDGGSSGNGAYGAGSLVRVYKGNASTNTWQNLTAEGRLNPVDTVTPWINVVQGTTSGTSNGSGYFKGMSRRIEQDQWLLDGWGKVALQGFGGQDGQPLVFDLAPLLTVGSIGNEFRGFDGMPLGHAAGQINGVDLEYLHLVYSPDDGLCCCRLVTLAGDEITAGANADGDIIHFQISVNTWDD